MMTRTPKDKCTSSASSTFLNQLANLRGFVTAMGLNHSEAKMSAALRSSGYNVEMALEKLLSGGDVIASSTSYSISNANSNVTKRSALSSIHANDSAMKRSKSTVRTISSIQTKSSSSSTATSNRLLLCKRWTITCSKSIRGQIFHGDECHFDENYKASSAKIDPMVRFRSRKAEGTLNAYLCSILGPLLTFPANKESICNVEISNGINSSNEQFKPLIHLAGEALMEDQHLKIGSDIPINLKIYLNDPTSFFNLFTNFTSNKSESSQFFGRKNTCKKGRSYDVKEAAFRLLQWAEMGEEIECGIDEVGDVDKKEMHVEQSESIFASKSDRDDGTSNLSDTSELLRKKGDGDYDEQLESEATNEFNQMLASDAKPQSMLELPDPAGLKNNVVLRPYQRQALYWMCRREGLTLSQLNMPGKEYDNSSEELELLSELAASLHSSSSNNGGMQIWGKSGIACDCGPILVEDDDIASRAVPVVDFGKKIQNGTKYAHHPLWKRRFLATDDLTTAYTFYVNELLGIASASPPNPPRQCVGGILADAMGLGKTVMLLSLILQSKAVQVGTPNKFSPTHAATDSEVLELSSDDDDETDKKYIDEHETQLKKLRTTIAPKSNGTTLIIAPLSLISQWEEEIASKTSLSALIYYNNVSKKIARGDSFAFVDVVITTYGTIQSEYVSMYQVSKHGEQKKPGANQPLLSFNWKRIILDEAHGIKNPTTIVSKACCLLRADIRWCVTGTPIQNSIQDVYGLLKFLRHEPWCEASFWKNAITSVIPDITVEGSDMPIAFERVKRVLSPIILRRTKDTLAEDGRPILTLPPIESAIIQVTLSPPEREFYNSLLVKSQSIFDGFLKAGTATKSWFAIFSLLQRLRQSCDHVSLTVQNRFDISEIDDCHDADHGIAETTSTENTVNNKFLTCLLSKFKKNIHGNKESTSFAKEVAAGLTQCLQSSDEFLTTECPICFDEPRIVDAVHTPCAHMFCVSCLIDEFHEQETRRTKQYDTTAFGNKKMKPNKSKVEGGECPICHTYMKTSQVIQIKKSDCGEMIPAFLNDTKCGKQSLPPTINQKRDEVARVTLESALKGANSSKLEAVLKEMEEIWKINPRSKILVFSQFLGFLDIITRSLHSRNIATFRIDGKMSLKERVKMIDRFNFDGEPIQDLNAENSVCQRGSVFLVSMKAGGCGLNLVAASTVFIIDPWWNQAIEDQCINRIHRIGQQADIVRVRKFVVENSVEEKIVKLQLKKKSMATDILDSNGSRQLESSKPTLEDFRLIFGN